MAFLSVAAAEKPSSLVPDVAYVSNGRLAAKEGEARERPAFAPDIAVEILSPKDRLPLLEAKIELYLENGALLVIVIDPNSAHFG
jgi:Uma2 family endonuclease